MPASLNNVSNDLAILKPHDGASTLAQKVPVAACDHFSSGGKGPRLETALQEQTFAAWPQNPKHARSTELTAVVRGAGPGGAAAACLLRRQGYQVVLVDKRESSFRHNVIACRQGTLDTLQDLASGSTEVFPLAWVQRNNFWAPKASVPPQGDEHKALLRIGSAESSLMNAARALGVDCFSQCTVDLSPASRGRRYAVTLQDQNDPKLQIHLGEPDLIVWASGGADSALTQQLKINRHRGYAPEEVSGLQDDGKISGTATRVERQYMLVFGVRKKDPADSSINTLRTRLEKHTDGQAAQPLQCGHLQIGAEHAFDLQLPRGQENLAAAQEQIVLRNINRELGETFSSLPELLSAYDVTFGSLQTPVVIENTLADTMHAGSNVVIAGDAGGTSSPAGGRGFATALRDAVAVGHLGAQLAARKTWKQASQESSAVASLRIPARRELIAQYGRTKLAQTLEWSRGARPTMLNASLPFEGVTAYVTQVKDTDLRQHVHTWPRKLHTPMPGAAQCTQAVADIAAIVGSALWGSLCEAVHDTQNHIDGVSSHLLLAPEGIHPEVVALMHPLLEKMLAGASPADVACRVADFEVAHKLRRLPEGSCAVVVDALLSVGIDEGVAPHTFAWVRNHDSMMLDLHEGIRQSLTLEGTTPDFDEMLAQTISQAAPEHHFAVLRTLEAAGWIARGGRTFGWVSTSKGQTVPRAMEALRAHNPRESFISEALAKDGTFEVLQRKQAAINRAITEKVEKSWLSPVDADTTGLASALLWLAAHSNQQACLDSRRPSVAAKLNPKQTACKGESVFYDHYFLRSSGELERDIRCNYHHRVHMPTNHGYFRGLSKGGVQDSAAVLRRLVPKSNWRLQRAWFGNTQVAGRKATVGYETWLAQLDAHHQVVGFDAFLFDEAGKILVQTVYYDAPKTTDLAEAQRASDS